MATNKEIRNLTNVFRVCRWVKGGKIEHIRALSHNSFTSLIVLDDVRLRLNKAYHLNLRAKPIIDIKNCETNVKKFCGELLDRCTPNHWKTTLRQSHACRKTRLSVASSLFSSRKLLPSKRPDVNAYIKRMSTAQDKPDLDFLSFCYDEIRRQFHPGWDRSYWSHVSAFTPPTKSNIQKKELGTYREQAVKGRLNRHDFLQWCDGKRMDELDLYCKGEAVETGGKWRCITLSHTSLSQLLPAHRTIYSHLSKKNWLLRGEAKPSEFLEFISKDGEVFVSGDYESATDNLNIHVTEHVLRCLLDTATHIPEHVKKEMKRSLRMRFVDDNGNFVGMQQRGQLMGNPLSFPLLCLINFITFKFAVRRKVPVKINGDDIIFRCTPEESARWFECVSASGLVVSKGKTLVDRSFFSLNSSYFLASNSGVSVIPHFRASCLKKCEDMGALTGRVAQIKRDLPVGAIRIQALRELFSNNRSVIGPSQGSFSRRYRCSVPDRVLRDLRLYEREAFYTSLPSEPEPLKSYCGWRQELVPGWTKEKNCCRGDRQIDSIELSRRFVSSAWEADIVRESKDEYYRRVRDGSLRFVKFRPNTYRMYAKLNKKPYISSRIIKHPVSKKIWLEKSVEGTDVPIAFLSGGYR